MTLQEYVESLRGKRVAVLGIGVSNTPLIDLLLDNGLPITVCDMRGEDALADEAETLVTRGAELRLGPGYLDDLNGFDVIFRTPGLLPTDKHLMEAAAHGAEITSEMEAFFRLCPCRTIGVTGSDGKTTTSSIIAELLKAAGVRVHLGGNIGKPLLCEIPDILPGDAAVLELSSFQLHSINIRPDVAGLFALFNRNPVNARGHRFHFIGELRRETRVVLCGHAVIELNKRGVFFGGALNLADNALHFDEHVFFADRQNIQKLFHALNAVLNRRQKQILLILKIFVKRADAHARLFGNGAHVCIFKAFKRKLFGRRVENSHALFRGNIIKGGLMVLLQVHVFILFA